VAISSFMPRYTRLSSILFLSASLAFPKRDLELCGTYPARGAEELALHRRAGSLRLAKQRARLASPRPAPGDIGNIAILEDADGVVERRNPFNLSQRAITFTNNSGTYRFSLGPAEYSTAIATAGTRVDGLGDDDTRNVVLPFAFPFYGATYNRLYVNSDGNFTFGAGDISTSDRSLGRMTAGLPRIAGFFEDLNATSGGEVRITSQPSLFAVSWIGVPEFATGQRNTFQIVLYPDGRIVLAYQTVNFSSAVVGIAPGNRQGGTSVVSFLTGSSSDFTGAVVERFSNIEEVDTVFAAQKFFETHEDVYDFLVFYNNLDVPAAAGAVAFESSVRSIVDGIGDTLLDNGRDYGSPRRLQAIMNMGPISQYPRNPNAIVPSRGTAGDTPLTVLGHEAGPFMAGICERPRPGESRGAADARTADRALGIHLQFRSVFPRGQSDSRQRTRGVTAFSDHRDGRGLCTARPISDGSARTVGRASHVPRHRIRPHAECAADRCVVQRTAARYPRGRTHRRRGTAHAGSHRFAAAVPVRIRLD
jgi:hypothetical protein